MRAGASRLRRWLAAAVALWVVVSGRAAWAQSFDAREAGWEGTKLLVELARAELGEARVVADNRLDWHALSPADAVLVIHPELVPDVDEVGAFLRAGGRMAVLDDFGAGDRLLGGSPYHIKRVPAPRAPLYALRGNPNLALAEPVAEVVAGRRGGVHPVVADVTRVVTNHPTGLSHPELTTVLRIRATGEPDVALAVAGQVGKGRLFAMGDPSAVINLMLRYPGNKAFALGLVRYLVEDDPSWGARGGRLFIVTNRFQEAGVFGASTGAERELKEWARSLRHEVQRVSGDGLPRHVALALAVLAGTGLLLWVLSSSARGYEHPLPRYVARVPLVAQGGAAGRLAVLSAPSTHRALVLLEQRDALEEQVCARLGLAPRPGAAALQDALSRDGRVPRETLDALRRLQARIARVETAVAAGAPVRVPEADLELMTRLTRELQQALVVESRPA
ncbi:MAG: DUF4350 domain-containing protein [Polyangiaceae bacterium]|nr:DUF4350 domain-containing protein [Polyangiaceae bacterium]